MRRRPTSPLSQAEHLLESLETSDLPRPQLNACAERLRRLVNRLRAAREEVRRHRALLADTLAVVESMLRMLRQHDETSLGER